MQPKSSRDVLIRLACESTELRIPEWQHETTVFPHLLVLVHGLSGSSVHLNASPEPLARKKEEEMFILTPWLGQRQLIKKASWYTSH